MVIQHTSLNKNTIIAIHYTNNNHGESDGKHT